MSIFKKTAATLLLILLSQGLAYGNVKLVKDGFGRSEANINMKKNTISNNYRRLSLNDIYTSENGKISIYYRNNKVYLITFCGEEFITRKGIKKGFSRDEVIARYGSPPIESSSESLFYHNLGIGFNFENNLVTHIAVIPVPDRAMLGDGAVIEGCRAGNIYLGMMISEIEKAWGKAEHITRFKEPSKSRMHFYSDSQGVILISERNRLTNIIILSPLYSFKNSISVGSATELLQKKLGAGEIKNDMILYPKKGINFKFKNGVITEISVYKNDL